MKRVGPRPIPRWQAMVIGGLVVTASAAAVAVNVHVWWRGQRSLVTPESLPPVGHALVLGARAFHGRPSAALEDRLAAAEALWRAGRVPLLLLSGDNRPGNREVDIMATWLMDRGIPPEALLRDDEGYDTHASVQRARDVYGVQRVVIISQRFHLPRALYIAEGMGVDAVGVAADARVYDRALHNAVRESAARLKAFVRRVTR